MALQNKDSYRDNPLLKRAGVQHNYTEEEIKEYKELLAQGLVAPTSMELYTCNIDGSDLKQITHLGKANWAPFFHPGGKKIIFSSNHHSKKGYDFQLFMINELSNLDVL